MVVAIWPLDRDWHRSRSEGAGLNACGLRDRLLGKVPVAEDNFDKPWRGDSCKSVLTQRHRSRQLVDADLSSIVTMLDSRFSARELAYQECLNQLLSS